MLKQILTLGAALVFLAGCSTEVDLNSDWKDQTIVYGVMDQNDEYHFIKINKAFLGDGNLYEYAQIRDSSEYRNLYAIIEEVSNGVVVDTYTLRDTTLTNRDTTGVFYAPDQTVYYFKKTALNQNNSYRLKIKINQGTEAEKEVSGETTLLTGLSIVSFPTLSVGSYDGTSSTYTEPNIKFTPPSNSNAFDIVWRTKWDEYDLSGTPTRKTFEWFVGSVDRTAMNSSGQVEFRVSGEAYFRNLANAIPNDINVTKRVLRAVDIIVYAGSDELKTYIDLNTPSSGLVQERPEYTNITNGYGIFTSRVHVTLANKHLGLGSYRELVHGPYTGHLLFCTDTTSTLYTLASPPTVVCP